MKAAKRVYFLADFIGQGRQRTDTRAACVAALKPVLHLCARNWCKTTCIMVNLYRSVSSKLVMIMAGAALPARAAVSVKAKTQ
jgi:hypothetical protein